MNASSYSNDNAAFDALRPSLPWRLISGIGGALAAIVVAGAVAGRLGLPIVGGWLLVAGLLGALPQFLAIGRGRSAARWPELAAALIAFGAVGGAGLALAWPSLLPLGLSVDAVHHTQLIAWIADQRALPTSDDATRGLLGEMTAYPVGLALVVIAAARLTGQPLLETIYPTAALLGGLIAAIVVLLSSAAGQINIENQLPPGPLRNRYRMAILHSQSGTLWVILNFLGLLLGPLLLLAHRTYLMEAYIDHSYYTMVLGVLLALLAAAWLIVEPTLSLGAAAQFGLVLAALIATYPLWAPLPAALALAVIFADNKGLMAPRGSRCLGGKKSLSYISRGLLALGPALILGLLDLLPRMGVGQTVLAHEGLVTLPTAQRLAPLLLALPCVALIIPRRPACRLVGLAALAGLAALGLALAARAGLAASYHSYKLLFLLTPLAAAIVGAAAQAGPGWTMPGTRSRWLPGLVAALALAATSSFQVIPPPAIQVLTPDLVAAASWLRANSPRDAARAIVVGVPPGPVSYWLQVGLLGQRRDKADMAIRAFTTEPPSPESWLLDQRLAPVAIALNAGQPLPGMDILARFGEATVIRRAERIDPASLNPLTISYRAFWEEERLQTAIELRRLLPGPLPLLELCLYHKGERVSAFKLPPEPERTRAQYLGAALIPATLGGEGYINQSAYPSFAPPSRPPTGALSLTLRLALAGNTLDERLLAIFERTADGRFEQVAPSSGELIYLRHSLAAGELRAVDLGFEDALRLTGWSGPARTTPRDTLTVGLRWQALRPLERSLFPELQLLDRHGQPVATSLAAPQGGFYPTWRWRSGESVTEQRSLQLPPDLTPGVYSVVVRVRDFVDERALSVDRGRTDGIARIGEILVER